MPRVRYSEKADAPKIIAGLVPAPYSLYVDETKQHDLGYFAELRRGAEVLKKIELYPHIVVGPGNSRHPDERRVELELERRTDEIVRDPPLERTGVMLGLRDRDIDGSLATPLVIAFAFGIYRTMFSRSSLQFPKQLLLEAEMFGASTFVKYSRRHLAPMRAITLAMQPEVLPLFLVALSDDLASPQDWEPSAVAEVQETLRRYYATPRELKVGAVSLEGALEGATSEIVREQRRSAARTITQPIRDGRFRQSVSSAYGHRCAACDMQLNLIEAAHIDPVKNLESVDEIPNGIALCVLHHSAFDKGLLDFLATGQIVVVDKRVQELKAQLRDGGLDQFRKNLRPSLRKPERREHWPSAENFARRTAYLRSLSRT